MLLRTYRKEIFRPECNPSFQSLHCIAHLKDDVSDVLPYLNAALGGDTYTHEPPTVTFKLHGKLITVSGNRIAINALKDEDEADKILDWIKREINEIWDNRESIEPSFQGASKPKVFEILKLLPKTNCRECGQPTCMVFASLIAEGAKGPNECPPLAKPQKNALENYLEDYSVDL